MSENLDRDEADEEVSDLHEAFGRRIEMFYRHWEHGLDGFIDSMNFASAQEAKANTNEAVVGAVAESLMNSAISQTGKVPIVGDVLEPVLKAVNAGSKAYYEEKARAVGASEEAEAKTYIIAMRGIISELWDTALLRHERNLDLMLRSQKKAAKNSPPPEVRDGIMVVYGDSARWFRRCREARDSFYEAIPSVGDFHQYMTELLVATSSVDAGTGTEKSINDVLRIYSRYRPESTRLSIQMKVKIRKSGEWIVYDIGKSWILNAPQAKRVAASLTSSLAGDSVLVDVNLWKEVHVSIQDEQSGTALGQGVVVLYIKPDRSILTKATTDVPYPGLGREVATSPVVAEKLYKVRTITGAER